MGMLSNKNSTRGVGWKENKWAAAANGGNSASVHWSQCVMSEVKREREREKDNRIELSGSLHDLPTETHTAFRAFSLHVSNISQKRPKNINIIFLNQPSPSVFYGQWSDSIYTLYAHLVSLSQSHGRHPSAILPTGKCVVALQIFQYSHPPPSHWFLVMFTTHRVQNKT